jgi:hypothetical protein
VHRDAPQAIVGGPEEVSLLADQGGQGRGVDDHVQEGLGAEVGAGRVDGEPERGGELVVVSGPLGAGDDARYPDPVPGQFGGRDRAGGGELVSRPDQELDGLVEDPGGISSPVPCPRGRSPATSLSRP